MKASRKYAVGSSGARSAACRNSEIACVYLPFFMRIKPIPTWQSEFSGATFAAAM